MLFLSGKLKISSLRCLFVDGVWDRELREICSVNVCCKELRSKTKSLNVTNCCDIYVDADNVTGDLSMYIFWHRTRSLVRMFIEDYFCVSKEDLLEGKRNDVTGGNGASPCAVYI